jgi:hypothetical protein
MATTVKTFPPYQPNICKSRIFTIVSEVEMTEILQETKSTHSPECFFLALQMNLVENETAFMMQILLQPGRLNLRNGIRLHVQYGCRLSTVSFSVKYEMNFLLYTVLAPVSVFS